MKSERLLIKLLFIPVMVLLVYFTGCKDNTVDVSNSEPQTDKQAFEKIADEDSSLVSFDQNYNEDGISDFLGKTAQQIYPHRFGHKAKLVSRTIDYNVVGDTAFAVLTKVYNDTLFIAATYDPTAAHADTVIKKAYTSTIVRNLIFVRTGNSNRPYQNWRLAAISLPKGNTVPHNDITINKITMVLPSESLVITDPLNYYLARGKGWWRQLPIVPKNTNVTVSVEVFSTVQDTDLVTLTWGADNMGMHRAKKRFTLLSSTPSGAGFIKIYQQTYSSNSNAGFMHAIINAFPKSVIFDDASAVQNESWGFPYFVRRM